MASPTETLPPYSPDGPCPKCGTHGGISTRYQRSCCAEHQEHLRRYCRTCSYEWPEAVYAEGGA